MQAVRKDVTMAHIQARITTARMLSLCCGHKLHREAVRIPIEAGLAKLHRAYVAIASDLGCKYQITINLFSVSSELEDNNLENIRFIIITVIMS